jgi:hypothetical protein
LVPVDLPLPSDDASASPCISYRIKRSGRNFKNALPQACVSAHRGAPGPVLVDANKMDPPISMPPVASSKPQLAQRAHDRQKLLADITRASESLGVALGAMRNAAAGAHKQAAANLQAAEALAST